MMNIMEHHTKVLHYGGRGTFPIYSFFPDNRGFGLAGDDCILIVYSFQLLKISLIGNRLICEAISFSENEQINKYC
jgi:hypothetical protein